MSDFILLDDQNVDVAVNVVDDAGNVVPGATFDAGSVTATLPETTNLIATVSADQTSVNVRAEGPLTTDDVLTVTGAIAGTPYTATLPFDVDVSAPAGLGLVPGTPEHN
jgi:hypothetical protein